MNMGCWSFWCGHGAGHFFLLFLSCIENLHDKRGLTMQWGSFESRKKRGEGGGVCTVRATVFFFFYVNWKKFFCSKKKKKFFTLICANTPFFRWLIVLWEGGGAAEKSVFPSHLAASHPGFSNI